MTPSVPAALLFLSVLGYAHGVPLENLQTISENALRQEFHKAFQTQQVTPVLKKVAQHLELEEALRGGGRWGGPERRATAPLFCLTCNAGVAEIIREVESGVAPEAIAAMMINLCVNLGIANLNFCEHFVMEAEPQLYWILSNRHLTGKDVCGMMFVGFGCDTDNPERVWDVTLPDAPKPPVTEPALPQPGSPVMKILHLADTHFDPFYKPGSNAECGEKYFCCREESGVVETPEAAAGYWGDYRNCDAPRWLLEAIFSHINETHKDLDLILWTGDLIPHNVWNTSREGNLDIIRQTVQMVKEYFPDTPVFPAIGNHESHPVNAFPQPYIENEFDISWLYDEISALWATWLPADVAASVTYSAFYSTLIKPGLRILSINTNYCYGFNWWIVYDDVDPASELGWMAQELQKAEDAGEKVYIISHIPPGHDDCSKTWSHQYNRIVYRYESTIAGLFYGHTHKDHYMMFYDPDEPERAYHVGYVAQSQTPYHKLNPGYKVYTVDGDYQGSSYRVLDHENWILDLDEVNESNAPRMYLLYTAMEAYELSDLTPASWSGHLHQMSEPNSTLFEDFFRYYTKAARPYQQEGCDEECKQTLLCRVAVSDTSDKTHCDHLRT
ncbi:sphingomyelin phosphodiesterase-like [Penaeus monodon]|uniref:sphingomyelin phosphodiesterase-like n=1 Tax=Penaeus monodon TaxID=6687 RepID=UPI0018A76E3E|nr:sphingomyelin phosphodiesterase-like [Penaeus monodon]